MRTANLGGAGTAAAATSVTPGYCFGEIVLAAAAAATSPAEAVVGRGRGCRRLHRL